MAVCKNCGNFVADGQRFCPSCGGEVVEEHSGRMYGSRNSASPGRDAEKNKNWGILAYIFFLIPLLGGPKDSKFTRYHTNQGLVFFIFWLALCIILNIIQSIVVAASFNSLEGLLYGFSGGFLAFTFIWLIYAVVEIAFLIIGIMHAVKGEMKPLPLIGKFQILK